MVLTMGFPEGSGVKNPSVNAEGNGDAGLIPGSGRSPGEGHGNPLQYSCLGNPVDGGAWWATVHGVTEGWMRLGTHRVSHARKCSLGVPVWGEGQREGWREVESGIEW